MRFAGVIVESVKAIFLILLDLAENRSPDYASMIETMTSGDGLGRVGRAYLKERSGQ